MPKAHHIVSYTVQLVLWAFFVITPFVGDRHLPSDNNKLIITYGLQHLNYFVFFYLNYFWFIPKFLYQKNLKTYLLIIVVVFILVFAVNNFLDHFIMHMPYRISAGNIVPIVQVYAVSTVFKLLIDQIQNAINRKALLEEKIRAELNYLRSQVNPHFLFNTLNNIAALIHINQDKAEQAVIKLSKIMRAMLADGNSKKISLVQELELIDSYIDLQKIRLNEDAKLEYSITGTTNDLMVEPLILINFIENVFKHGLSDTQSVIKINISITGNILELITENTISQGKKDETSGIGLSNVRKRLEIVYENKHKLNVYNNGEMYKVHLQIEMA